MDKIGKVSGVSGNGGWDRKRSRLAVIAISLLLLAMFFTVWFSVKAYKKAGGLIKENPEAVAKLLLPDDDAQSEFYLPEYDAADFKQVLELPKVNALVVWRDFSGMDCIAAAAFHTRGFNSGTRIAVWDSSFSQISDIVLIIGPNFSMSPAIYVTDISSDGRLEVVTGYNDRNSDYVVCYSIDGKQLWKLTRPDAQFQRFYIVPSPIPPARPVIYYPVSGFGYSQGVRVISIPAGTREVRSEELFETAITGSTIFREALQADWNFDGIVDLLFVSSGFLGETDHATPYVNGRFEKSFFLPEFDTGDAIAIAKYRDLAGVERVLFALHSIAVFDAGGKPVSGEIPGKLGSVISWRTQDGSIEGAKQYVFGALETPSSYSSRIFKEDNLAIADLTGDGIPEIVALVGYSCLTVLSVDGRELFKRELFKISNDIDAVRDMTCGDFDGDGVMDIAFICEGGIFIPNLNMLKSS